MTIIETIIIDPKDMPKKRNLVVVDLINRRGKGAHKDIRKEAERKACRKKVSKEDE